MCAVLVAYPPQVVDARDKGADKHQVDCGAELGIVLCCAVGKEGGYGPEAGQDGDDEEDQDVGGREGVGFCVDVDEPTQHAQGWDESYYLEGALGEVSMAL